MDDTNALILSTIPSVVVLVDGNGLVSEWNRAAQDLFGISRCAAVGRSLDLPGIDWNTEVLLDNIHATLQAREPRQLDEMRYLRPDGKQGILGMTLIPVLGEGREPLGCILHGADITARKRLEGQLAHAQKMESIGQLAAGVAHEINTPIQYVGDNIRFLQEAFADLEHMLEAYQALVGEASGYGFAPQRLAGLEALAAELDLAYLHEEIPRAITQSLEGVDHVATIVRAMKQFSHPGSQDKTAADLNAAITSTVTVSRNEWKYVADTVLDLDPGLPPVPCLLGDFNQAILNIIVNAAHAIADKLGQDASGKGRITLATRRDGDWAEIRISDTGTGIAEKIRTRIFDPFFTTKEIGQGTGQGLALAYSMVVEKHAGQIRFETVEEQGTTFIIRLPLADKEAQP